MEHVNTPHLPLHPWVHPIALAYLPGHTDPLLERVVPELLEWFRGNGHRVQSDPDDETELILTTARFNRPIGRDDALLFNAKRRYGLARRPQVLTLVSLTESEYAERIAHFAELGSRGEVDPAGAQYIGLGPLAVEVLIEQARRDPEMALGRLIQGQAISIRVMAVVSDEAGLPLRALHFDLAGAHPTSDATDPKRFAAEAGGRILTAVCAHEVDHHDLLDDRLPREVWESLDTPEAMIQAGATFARFGFFNTPIAIEKILGYRGIGDAIAAQYSEGCYAVFEPEIPGLVTTATGSSRLVDKRSITRDDQAIVIGMKPGRDGARIMGIEGRSVVLPSVEAVEMMAVCEAVPWHTRTTRAGRAVKVPAIRSILHGHLGVEAFDLGRVESVALPESYYTYLVSCGTGALADGTAEAFARSSALRDLADPRGVVFLEQPGHGVVVVEKWVEGKVPFQTIREYLETGRLRMTSVVPQGQIQWAPHDDRMLKRGLERIGEQDRATGSRR